MPSFVRPFVGRTLHKFGGILGAQVTVCKQAAPILALLAERRGLPVLVASADARPIAPFPSFVPLAGHPIAGAIDRFPTTLVCSSTAQGLVGTFEGYRDPAHYVSPLNALLEQAEALA